MKKADVFYSSLVLYSHIKTSINIYQDLELSLTNIGKFDFTVFFHSKYSKIDIYSFPLKFTEETILFFH